MPPNPPHLFGIRHHGPGSSRSVLRALEALQPDALLVEGPPDAAEVLPLIGQAGMQPPVALLIYAPDEPHKAVYYPFATFSPEWNALRYGLRRQIPVCFIDLAQTYQLALEPIDPDDSDDGPLSGRDNTDNPAPAAIDPIRADPLGTLAKAAGYADGERWWEQLVEQRQDSTDLFKGILEAMVALREAVSEPIEPREAQREAAMRQAIRAAQKNGFERIAVVCGAWHTPALAAMPTATADRELLSGLPKIKVTATWIPWTHGRLTRWSGYGAGVQSPGWYQHLWEQPDHVAVSWLTKTAHLLRGEGLDASTAQVIDALRLADTLAAMRDTATPGLGELIEATRTVLCFGSDKPLELIQRRLIVGETMGDVPESAPTIPLQADLNREQRRLQLRPTAEPTELSLDLRKPTHLERSHLLHRLTVLAVGWGQKGHVTGQTGTFHELWALHWRPDLTIALIEKSAWGNTIYDAATAYARHLAASASELPVLTALIGDVLLAELPNAIGPVVGALQTVAALTADVKQLMASVPALAEVFTYGSVRGTQSEQIGPLLDGIVARVWIGLPAACVQLADEAAEDLFNLLIAFDNAVRLLANADYATAWAGTLRSILTLPNSHGLLAGRCVRLLLDSQQLSADEVGRVMRLETSQAKDPPQTAAWLDGLLRGSGTILTHNAALLQIIDGWLLALDEALFVTILPLLRRTTATFSNPERQQIGRLVRGTTNPTAAETTAEGPKLHPARSAAVLETIAHLLGLNGLDNPG